MQTPVASGPQDHGGRLRNNALNLVGNLGLALGSAAPTVDRADPGRDRRGQDLSWARGRGAAACTISTSVRAAT
jgi:hypothetical protein